jgi:hypothetical protein
LSFIVQQWPEAKTYSAGTVVQALYKADKNRYARHISMYAWMVAMSQKVAGPQTGSWTYDLVNFPKDFDAHKNYENVVHIPNGRSDNSNSQFGVLAAVYAEKAGVQMPKAMWKRAQAYYMGAQHQDGGWDYQSEAYRRSTGNIKEQGSTSSMTYAGTVSLYLINEMLEAGRHDQCKFVPESKEVEAGFKWLADHFSADGPYGWYACERLGILSGRSEFGGHDWYQEGAQKLVPLVTGGMEGQGWHGVVPNLSFGVLFLSRGLSPIIINKLKRSGDWENHRHDVQHLVEYISEKFQWEKQWRIVTLDASVDFLLKVPILWISGHDKLVFTDAEKKKLKEYVERGGTILGEACCSKKEFDESFRALVAELWPQSQLTDLPATHPIFHTPRPLKDFRTKVQGCAIASNQGRLGVLYIPNGISCQWERGNASAVPAMDIGANIFFYVDKVASKMKAPEQIEKEHVATKPSAPLPASEQQPPADAPKDPVKDAPAETPKDVPAVTPADAPKEAPKEAPKDAPKDEAKDGKDQAAQEEK